MGYRTTTMINDLLMLVEDLDTAKTLVKNDINMCRSCEFNLTNFISISKELLIPIPDNKSRPGVKDLDLLECVPVDKALSIQWNIAEDYFSSTSNTIEET